MGQSRRNDCHLSDDPGCSEIHGRRRTTPSLSGVVQARILTEPELYMKLSEKGFNPEDIADTLEQEGRLPQSLSKTDLADLLWYWHGFEVGDKVWIGDLNQIAGNMHAVQPSEIEKVRKKISR
jgi:hypothetical protein